MRRHVAKTRTTLRGFRIASKSSALPPGPSPRILGSKT
jgi:hypothetical protein